VALAFIMAGLVLYGYPECMANVKRPARIAQLSVGARGARSHKPYDEP
jgi:hypothetical protein